MTSSKSFTVRYRLKAQFVFAVLLVVLLNRYFSHASLFAMKQPSFLFEQSEGLYGLFMASHLSQFLTGTFAAVVFDVLLLLIPVAFVFTEKRIFAIATTVLLLLYFLTFNVVTGHHYHGLIGAIIISIPFWTKNETRFNLLWQGARYYFLYIFASAALWKILRGSVFYTDQLSNILKSQQLDLLLQRPDSFQAHVVQYLIANPTVSHWVLVVNVLVQLCFLVGFFTKRFDAGLFVLAIVFCVANYFAMSIVSAELLILNLTLINWEWIESWFGKPKA